VCWVCTADDRLQLNSFYQLANGKEDHKIDGTCDRWQAWRTLIANLLVNAAETGCMVPRQWRCRIYKASTDQRRRRDDMSLIEHR